MTSRLFFNDFDILDHGNAATLRELAFNGDVFTAVFSELIVDWLMFANYEICFSLADDTDWSTTLDALRPTRLTMYFLSPRRRFRLGPPPLFPSPPRADHFFRRPR